MAVSGEVFCSLCEASHFSPKAVEFCPECHVYLCSNCKLHHGISILFKLHKTIPIQEYQKLPTFITSITPFCEEHEQHYDLYCYDHRQPCCIRCLSKHKQCTEISPLVETIKDIKDSTLSVDLEQTVNDLTNYIEKIKNVLEQNKNEIINQKSIILDQIRVVREQIIARIDSLEQNLVDTLLTSINRHVEEIDGLLVEIDLKKTTLLQLSEDWTTTKKYASEFQAFFGMSKLETNIEKEEQYLRSLSTNGSLDAKTFELVPKNIAYDTLDMLDVSILGDIRISSISTGITLVKEKDKQAQIGTLVSKSIDNINVKIESRIHIKNQPNDHIINGSTMLPNGDCVFVEYNNCRYTDRVIRVTGERKPRLTKWEFIPNGSIYDISVVNENTLAVSGCHFGKPKIFVVDFNTDTIVNTLVTDNTYYSLTSSENVILGIDYNGIYSTDVKSNRTNLIMSETFQVGESSITLFMEKIFVSNRNGYVVCCDMSGNVEWKFKEESLLKKPTGIAVDNHGNVFVADKESETVVVISPCGLHCRKVLDKTDGLANPRSLYFNKKLNCLVVCNSRENVFVCNISYV